VDEPWERQLRRATASTDGVLGLEDADADPMAREHDRGGEPVRPAADDDGTAFSQM
jgi:hypothetical protein